MDDNKFEIKKRDMMCLWKAVFNDADEYINLLFNSYYNDEMFVARYDHDRLISQLCCIPYRFSAICDMINAGSDNSCVGSCQTMIDCGYLCGLATLPEYRNSGIMSSLINMSDIYLRNNGFAISFLIPASKNLRLYYGKFGYTDISYYTSRIYIERGENTKNYIIDYNHTKSLYSVETGVYKYSVIDVNEYLIKDFGDVCMSCESRDMNIIYAYLRYAVGRIHGIVIRHSYFDFITVLRENIIGGGYVLFIKDGNNKPSGLLFCSNITEGEATVQLLVAESEESANILLHILKSLLPDDTNVMVHEYDGAVRKSSQHDLTEHPEPGHGPVPSGETMPMTNGIAAWKRKSFAMARILNVAEILKFAACLYPDSKFSILVNHDDFTENEGFYEVRNGKVSFMPLSGMTEAEIVRVERCCSIGRDCFRLTVPELAAILWRDISDPIESNMAVIPCMPIVLFLMLE